MIDAATAQIIQSNYDARIDPGYNPVLFICLNGETQLDEIFEDKIGAPFGTTVRIYGFTKIKYYSLYKEKEDIYIFRLRFMFDKSYLEVCGEYNFMNCKCILYLSDYYQAGN